MNQFSLNEKVFVIIKDYNFRPAVMPAEICRISDQEIEAREIPKFVKSSRTHCTFKLEEIPLFVHRTEADAKAAIPLILSR